MGHIVPRVETLEADEGQHYLLSAFCPSMKGTAPLSYTLPLTPWPEPSEMMTKSISSEVVLLLVSV